MEHTDVHRKMGLYLYLILVIRLGIVESAKGVLLPFGTGEGDTFLRNADEYSHDEIPLDQTFTFLDTDFQSLYINVNGIISFKNPLTSFSTDTLPIAATPFVAPYWADVDTRDFGAISFRQVSWAGSDDAILHQVNEIIRASFVDQQDFSASFILMASWNKVGFNAQIDSSRVNTFQCILVTDGHFSGVIFNYDTLLWTSDIFNGGNQFTGLGGIPAQIGFNKGDGIHAYTVHTSRTEEVINMTILSNVNVPGRFVYRVDLPEIKDPACKAEGNVHLFLAIDTMLGGNRIFIQGPCYDLETSHVVCKFEDTLSVGTVESSLSAFCVSPTLFTAGDVAVQISLDGGSTFPFTGHLQVEFPRTSSMVFKVNENEWLTSNDLELMWDTQVLEGVDTVDVVVYSYWESPEGGQMNWKIVETLASGVTYSDGGLNFVKPPTLQVTEDGSDLMGVIGVIENVAEAENKIPRAIWSDVDSLQWLFPQNSTSWCTEWTNSNGLPERIPQDIGIACPCVLRQAKKDLGRYRPRQGCRDDAWGKFPQNCKDRPDAFHCVVTRPVGLNGAGQECCYDISGILIEDRFAESGFGLARHHHTGPLVDDEDAAPGVPYFSHFYHDIIPEMQCCKFGSSEEATGGSDSSCSGFMARRPSQSCRFYEVPKPASIFGASHVTTFDGLQYTFPARGEYILLQTTEEDFMIQGRLEPIDTGDGATSSVMTAIAIKQRDSDVIHIQTSPRLHIDVFVGREDEPFSLIDSIQSHSWSFKGVDVLYSDSIYRDGVELYYNQGVGILVKATGESLRCIVIVPPEFQNRTDGLLGSWNGNAEDDLELDDGTILSHDSFGEDIVNSFGTKWLLEEDDDSLFYYLPGYSRDIYLYSEQPPISFDPEPEVDPLMVCGDNTLCALDLAISMNNDDFARGTLNAQSELQTTREDLAEVDKSFLLCPEVFAPSNGNIQESSNRYFGDIVTFSCDDCYELIGNSTLSCKYDLSWSDDIPVCNRKVNSTCQIPDKLYNGTFHVAECNRSVSFSCGEGFDLIGQELIMCYNGSWSDDAPTCELHVETTVLTHTTVTAETPSFVETEQPTETTKFVGDHPNSDVNTTCFDPDPPVNGTLEMSSNSTTAFFFCDRGFMLIGRAEITCYNASWSGEAPLCLIQVCSAPEPPGNGTLEMASNNTTAFFYCDQGFMLIGQEEITCQNGSWSEETPSCVQQDHVILAEISEYRTDSGFMLWWIFVLFVSIIVIALIIVVLFLCCGLKAASEKSGDTSTGRQYELVANT